jgi:hypothetical protein
VSLLVVSAIAATLAAALYALASALQHRSTADVRLEDPSGQRSLIRFASRTVRHRSWLLGTAASVGAVGLHAVALHDGPLALVQPVMITGVVFALPLRSWLGGQPVSRSEVAWAAMMAAALAGFLVVATPSAPTTLPADKVPAAAVGLLVAASVVACLWGGRRAGGRRPAALLGAAAGLTFAASAALLKTTTDVAGSHVGGLLTSWPLYALAFVGITGLLINQLAYQAGPLRWSLPAISTMDPMASLVIAIVVYDERLRGGLSIVLLEVALLATVVACTVALTRCDTEVRAARTLPEPTEAGRAA